MKFCYSIFALPFRVKTKKNRGILERGMGDPGECVPASYLSGYSILEVVANGPHTHASVKSIL